MRGNAPPPQKKISKKNVSLAILEVLQSALETDCRKVSDSGSALLISAAGESRMLHLQRGKLSKKNIFIVLLSFSKDHR